MSSLAKVKWFDEQKGFGFAINAEGKDVFIHYSKIIGEGFRTLSEDQQIQYDEVETEKGLQAENVKPL